MYNHYMFQCLSSIILLFRHLIANIAPVSKARGQSIYDQKNITRKRDYGYCLHPTGNAIKTQYGALIRLFIKGQRKFWQGHNIQYVANKMINQQEQNPRLVAVNIFICVLVIDAPKMISNVKCKLVMCGQHNSNSNRLNYYKN